MIIWICATAQQISKRAINPKLNKIIYLLMPLKKIKAMRKKIKIIMIDIQGIHRVLIKMIIDRGEVEVDL